jgi:hypothetical protein
MISMEFSTKVVNRSSDICPIKYYTTIAVLRQLLLPEFKSTAILKQKLIQRLKVPE